MLAELNLRLDYLLQTHLHDDEPNDAVALKERTGARVVASEPFIASADIPVRHGDTITFGSEVIRVIGTPGHTPGRLSYLWHDRVFTGDALLMGRCGRTGLMGEDSAALYDSITHRLFVLCGYAAMTARSRRNSRTISLPRFRSHTASALIDTVLASLVRAGSPNSTVLQRSP